MTSFSSGARLGAYEVVSPLGAGGMMINDDASSEPSSTGTPASMVVVLNWLEELKTRVK